MEVPVHRSSLAQFFFYNTDSAWFWLIIRLYVGYEWLMAGWGKLGSPAWTGDNAGTAVTGFLKGALTKTTGDHPDVSMWYAWFVETVALPNATLFSYLVTYGEILVGVALIVGFLVGIAAFFGAVMNFSFLFAGTVSVNPELLLLQIFLILAWRVAGWYGADQKALPFLRRRSQ
ncbi:MAG: thiosulfate dehydrogenase (quinone) large subunit [Patescibacteria group bacterium]|nr:thiosulfate dehydrogenase (quinone) large subunit [Patescibacteria group bacterium]